MPTTTNYVLFFIFLGAILGGSLSYLLPRYSHSLLSQVLQVSGSYLLCFSFIHLLPDIFSHAPVKDFPFLGFCIAFGFFLQIALDFVSKGLAHGHKSGAVFLRNIKFSQLTMLFLALTLHALLDGILLGKAHPADPTMHQHGLFVGIFLHKLPVAFALTSFLRSARCHNHVVFLLLFIFALASPLGALLNLFLHDTQLVTSAWLEALPAVAVGGLLHISNTILFESNPNHNPNFKQIAATATGVLLGVISSLV